MVVVPLLYEVKPQSVDHTLDASQFQRGLGVHTHCTGCRGGGAAQSGREGRSAKRRGDGGLHGLADLAAHCVHSLCQHDLSFKQKAMDACSVRQ